MNKNIIDYLTGELNLFNILRFKWQLLRNKEMKKTLNEYKEIWNALEGWEEKITLPDIEIVKKFNYGHLLRYTFTRTHAILVIALIGLGVGFYIGYNSYISENDYMNYALEVLYEE
jgi:hypothetical protein